MPREKTCSTGRELEKGIVNIGWTDPYWEPWTPWKGKFMVSWEQWEFPSPQEFLRILETELLIMANWIKWCKCMINLPLTELWPKCFETNKAEYWVLIPFSLHFCCKTRSCFCLLKSLLSHFTWPKTGCSFPGWPHQRGGYQNHPEIKSIYSTYLKLRV